MQHDWMTSQQINVIQRWVSKRISVTEIGQMTDRIYYRNNAHRIKYRILTSLCNDLTVHTQSGPMCYTHNQRGRITSAMASVVWRIHDVTKASILTFKWQDSETRQDGETALDGTAHIGETGVRTRKHHRTAQLKERCKFHQITCPELLTVIIQYVTY